jgi:hypothetical protein
MKAKLKIINNNPKIFDLDKTFFPNLFMFSDVAFYKFLYWIETNIQSLQNSRVKVSSHFTPNSAFLYF